MLIVRSLVGVAALCIALSASGPALARGDCCPPPQPCCQPCVIYVNSPCSCCEMMTQVLEVCHPCTGCKVSVPICIPKCCTGEPCVSFRHTLFGCGLSTYEWCCGHGVKIRYTKCGDVKVVYY
jgi:hypothetical protein